MLNFKTSKILTTIAMLTVLGMAGCQSEQSNLQRPIPLPKRPTVTGEPLVSDSGRIQLTLPKGWDKQSTEAPLTLSMTSPSQDAYITLQTRQKQKVSRLSLSDISQLNRQASSLTFSDLEVEPTNVNSVNGYPAVQYLLRGSLDDVKMVLLLTTVETPDHFHQLLAGTSQFSYKRYQDILQRITQSLHELAPKDAQT